MSLTSNVLMPHSVDEVQRFVRHYPTLQIVGGGTKRNTDTHQPKISSRSLTGITEYDPSEFTLSAWAGTPLLSLRDALGQNGQHMPFDPIMIEQGATLGGMVAAGICGPCRMKYGGLRDFILGVQWVDGTGTVARGGGKVVKNAAGFDIPKLMVGSWGTLGMMTQVTLKVFPRPHEYRTVKIVCKSLNLAIECMLTLANSPLDIEALDVESSGIVWVRLGGLPQATEQGGRRVMEFTKGSNAHEVLEPGHAEQEVWTVLQNWSWLGESEVLVRVPLIPDKILGLDDALQPHAARRRYSVAGNVAWIAWPIEHSLDVLDRLLQEHRLSGNALRGHTDSRLYLGHSLSNIFGDRIRAAMDPDGRFIS